MLNAEDYTHFRDTMPVVSVDLIVFNSEGKALLGKRLNEPARGSWFVPGGRLWKDESLSDATRRISKAEFGVELSPVRTLGTYEQVYTDTDKGRHFITLAVIAHMPPDAASGPLNHDDQHSELKWWDTTELVGSSSVHLYSKSYFSPSPWNQIGGNF